MKNYSLNSTSMGTFLRGDVPMEIKRDLRKFLPVNIDQWFRNLTEYQPGI